MGAIASVEPASTGSLFEPRVLVAEARVDVALQLRALLREDGFTVEQAASSDAALDAAIREAFDLVILNLRLPGAQELRLLERLQDLRPSPDILVSVDATAASLASEAQARLVGRTESHDRPDGAKPGPQHAPASQRPEPSSERPPMLRASATRGPGVRATGPRSNGSPRTSPSQPPPSFEPVASSPTMRQLLELVDRVALSSAPVLIHGETGAGKERLARTIHEQGPRRARPFVAVNAAAIPEQLLESEMFGHVRGAFTGATQTRVGVFDEADGGTVLLDEIGDMPLSLQPKLLRALQFGEVRPVGSDKVHYVDVRVIAATHRNLETLVREGRFRDDLRYRLNVLTLDIPPLRMRREDIPPLAEHFLQVALSRTPSSPVRAIDERAMAALRAAPWPGNVRELENTIERLVVLGDEELISDRHLDASSSVVAEAGPWLADPQRLMTLRELNQSYLSWVLEQTHGDKAEAARILGIDLSTLYRWQRAKT